jgi:probable rRNA maturation factor
MSDQGDSASIISADADAAAEAEPPERLAIVIVEEGGDWSGFGPLAPAIASAAVALARHPVGAPARGADASVVLASDAIVRPLNRTFRGKDAATNVLSFPFQPPPGIAADADGRICLGDVVLAAETVLREARDLGVPPLHHLQHLVVHGLLHLLGFDHQSDGEAQAMELVETQVLASLGIADPYAADPA